MKTSKFLFVLPLVFLSSLSLSFAEVGYGTWMLFRSVEKATEKPLSLKERTLHRSCNGNSGTQFSLHYAIVGPYSNKFAHRKVSGKISNHPINISNVGSIRTSYSAINYISSKELTLNLATYFDSRNLPYLSGTATLRKDKNVYEVTVTCR